MSSYFFFIRLSAGETLLKALCFTFLPVQRVCPNKVYNRHSKYVMLSPLDEYLLDK